MIRQLSLALFPLATLLTACSFRAPDTLPLRVNLPQRPGAIGFERISRGPWLARSEQAHSRAAQTNRCLFVNVIGPSQLATIAGDSYACWLPGAQSAPFKKVDGETASVTVSVHPAPKQTVQVLELRAADGTADACTGSVAERVAAGASVSYYGAAENTDLYAGSQLDIIPNPYLVGNPLSNVCSPTTGTGPALAHRGLYVINTGECRLKRIDRVTGDMRTVAGGGCGSVNISTGVATTSILPAIFGAVIDDNGDIFLSSNDAVGNVYRVTPTGGISLYNSGIFFAQQLAIDGNSTLYSPGFLSSQNKIARFTIGPPTKSGALASTISGVAVVGGNVYATSGNMLYRWNGTASVVPTLLRDYTVPLGYLAVDSDDNLFVTSPAAGQIWKVAPPYDGTVTPVPLFGAAGGALASFQGDLSLASGNEVIGVAYDAGGFLYFTDTAPTHLLRVINFNDNSVKRFAGLYMDYLGTGDGDALTHSLYYPQALMLGP